jgi:hypothetical protein
MVRKTNAEKMLNPRQLMPIKAGKTVRSNVSPTLKKEM